MYKDLTREPKANTLIGKVVEVFLKVIKCLTLAPILLILGLPSYLSGLRTESKNTSADKHEPEPIQVKAEAPKVKKVRKQTLPASKPMPKPAEVKQPSPLVSSQKPEKQESSIAKPKPVVKEVKAPEEQVDANSYVSVETFKNIWRIDRILQRVTSFTATLSTRTIAEERWESLVDWDDILKEGPESDLYKLVKQAKWYRDDMSHRELLKELSSDLRDCSTQLGNLELDPQCGLKGSVVNLFHSNLCMIYGLAERLPRMETDYQTLKEMRVSMKKAMGNAKYDDIYQFRLDTTNKAKARAGAAYLADVFAQN